MLTLALISCGLPWNGQPHSGHAKLQVARITSPGPCRGLLIPQTVLIQREPTPDAKATGFPLTNISPFSRSLGSEAVTRQLMAAACATPPGRCVTISVFQGTVLNGYIVTFFYEKHRVATLVGTPAVPCGTLFLIPRTRKPSPAQLVAPFVASYHGWIDLAGNAHGFFAELASALKVPVQSLTS